MPQNNVAEEIESFDGLWEGGYYEGNPLSALGKSTYGIYGYVSILHAVYLRCIKPYINAETVALEIGPGRGAWTKGMLDAKEVWTLDALSAEYNQFFEYLNHPKNVKYFQVEDFECKELPENYFNYMFSFGCLCHVSFEGISEYAANIFGKLQSNTPCFWMIADKQKYSRFIEQADNFDIWNALAPKRKNLAPLKYIFKQFSKISRPDYMNTDEFEENKGHWYDAGTERTCEMLEKIGYKIIEPDIGLLPRDPMIHFIKP